MVCYDWEAIDRLGSLLSFTNFLTQVQVPGSGLLVRTKNIRNP